MKYDMSRYIGIKIYQITHVRIFYNLDFHVTLSGLCFSCRIQTKCDTKKLRRYFHIFAKFCDFVCRRGLSRFFQGKSQSFTSLSKVGSIEDLAKKENPYNRRKMKACKSYGGGLDSHKLYTLPKATISKKASRGSSSFISRRSGSFLGTNRLPPLPAQRTSDVCT